MKYGIANIQICYREDNEDKHKDFKRPEEVLEFLKCDFDFLAGTISYQEHGFIHSASIEPLDEFEEEFESKSEMITKLSEE